jgi:hypothetical protein
MSDGSATEHTLLLVEEADSGDPDIYQVVQLEHPPDSNQVKIVEEAMAELVAEAESETGRPHEFLKESGPPREIQRDYTSHEVRLEKREYATDGGGTEPTREENQDGTNNTHTGHVGPIIFSNEQARSQLLEEGEVYTFRANKRTTGETWARASRTGPKIADVVVEEVCAIPAPRPADLQDEWAAKSGFGSRSAWWEAIEELHGTPQSGVVYRCELVNKTGAAEDIVTDGGMALTATEHTDGGDMSEAQRREKILRLSRGEICLRWPAGQLLCPHYATWAEDAEDNLKVYVPQDGGRIVTGDSATRMIAAGGLTNKHATLRNRQETPFEERELDE